MSVADVRNAMIYLSKVLEENVLTTEAKDRLIMKRVKTINTHARKLKKVDEMTEAMTLAHWAAVKVSENTLMRNLDLKLWTSKQRLDVLGSVTHLSMIIDLPANVKKSIGMPYVKHLTQLVKKAEKRL